MATLAASGVLCAAGSGAPALFDAALAAAPLGRPVDRYDAQRLRTRTATLLPASLLADLGARWPGLDPALALALGATEQATGGAPLPADTALVVGTSLGCTASWEPWHRALAADQPLPQAPAGAAHGDLAWQMARALGLRGPALTVSTACTSSSMGLIVAADLLRLGEADQALVVGVDLLGAFVHVGFDVLRALSPDDRPPTPFGAERAGLWLGEAAACVLLRRSGPGLGRYLGGAAAGDAFHMTAPDREGRGLTRAVRGALDQASLAPADVTWISAHATATTFNDAMEAVALRRVFGEALPPVHALKPVVGHTLGACGLLEVALILEAMRRRLRPPTFAPGPLDPALPPVPLDRAPARWSPGPVLSVNAAFAGHCTALCIGPEP